MCTERKATGYYVLAWFMFATMVDSAIGILKKLEMHESVEKITYLKLVLRIRSYKHKETIENWVIYPHSNVFFFLQPHDRSIEQFLFYLRI